MFLVGLLRHPQSEPQLRHSEAPKKWKAFQDFTHEQMRELMQDYGPMDIYQDGNTFFTVKGKQNYVIHLLPEGQTMPKKISWQGNLPTKSSTLRLLSTGETVPWRINKGKVQIEVPESLLTQKISALAFVYE